MKDHFKLPILQFAALVVYIVLQLVWWAWLIRDLNLEVHDLTLMHLQDSAVLSEAQKAEIDRKLNMRNLMIIGEGFVFLIILFLGIWQILKALRRESRLIRFQNNFLMAVSHELKSPVTAIRLQIETLLRKEHSREKVVDLLDHALEETNRLSSMIDNVLMANRLEQEAFHAEIQQVDIAEECRRCIKLFSKGIYEGRKISLQAEGELRVQTDPVALRSIVENLVENALKYSPAGKPVEIIVVKERGNLLIEVRDYGPGIAAEERTLIFKKFYRSGNEETRKSKGSGLGLYIVANLVRILQGEIKVASHADAGSSFLVRLPTEIR